MKQSCIAAILTLSSSTSSFCTVQNARDEVLGSFEDFSVASKLIIVGSVQIIN
jgi:hypothetical protein